MLLDRLAKERKIVGIGHAHNRFTLLSSSSNSSNIVKIAATLHLFTDVAMLIDIILLGVIKKVIIYRILVYLPNVTNFDNFEINNRFK